jgi:hypothetical protein
MTLILKECNSKVVKLNTERLLQVLKRSKKKMMKILTRVMMIKTKIRSLRELFIEEEIVHQN